MQINVITIVFIVLLIVLNFILFNKYKKIINRIKKEYKDNNIKKEKEYENRINNIREQLMNLQKELLKERRKSKFKSFNYTLNKNNNLSFNTIEDVLKEIENKSFIFVYVDDKIKLKSFNKNSKIQEVEIYL
jgi:SOS-response transcriptional repressor LexA